MEFCVQYGLLCKTCTSGVKSLVYWYAQGFSVTSIVCRPCWAVVHWQCFINGNFIIHYVSVILGVFSNLILVSNCSSTFQGVANF